MIVFSRFTESPPNGQFGVLARLFSFIPVLCLAIAATYWFLPLYFVDVIPSSREGLATSPFIAFFLLQVLAMVIVFSSYQSAFRSFFLLSEHLYLAAGVIFLLLVLGLARVLRGDGVNITQLGVLALSGIIGIGLSTSKVNTNGSHLISPVALLALVGALLIFMGYFYKNAFESNAVLLVPSATLGGLPRPQVTEVLTSTELSNILASLYLLLISYYRDYAIRTNCVVWAKRSLQVAGAVTMLLFILCGSVAGIAALMAIIVLSSKSKSLSITFYLTGVLTIFFGVILFYGIEMSNQTISVEAFVAKFTDEQRSDLYPHALRLFLDNFYTGIGESRLVYSLGMWPHNNILALGGSFGFLGVIVYSFLMVVTLYACGTLGREVSERSFLATTSVTISAFLMLKGFVHDTWFDPMIWFGVGAAGALLTQSQRQEYNA